MIVVAQTSSSHSAPTSLLTGVIIAAFVGLAMFRRMRAQPVNPMRAVVFAGIVAVISAFTLFGTHHALDHPVTIFLAPVGLVIGFAIGLALVSTITFWHDETTGALWMKGGVIYISAWLAILVLRLGLQYAGGGGSNGSTGTSSIGWEIVSADLLFLSVGLWVARAFALIQRYRADPRSPQSSSRTL